MRSALVFLFAATLPALAHAAETPAAPSVTVLKAARIFDATSDSVKTGGVIVVENGRIKAIGGAVPAGATVIDLGDATLLPGFIDAHVHMTGQMGDNWYKDTVDGMRQTVAEQAIRSTEYARKTLMAGFTTVRNVGASDAIDIGLRNAINAGVVQEGRTTAGKHPSRESRSTRRSAPSASGRSPP